MAISVDGERTVSGSDDLAVRIWDMGIGQCVGEPLRGHGGLMSSVAISGDGQRILSRSTDRTVRIES